MRRRALGGSRRPCRPRGPERKRWGRERGCCDGAAGSGRSGTILPIPRSGRSATVPGSGRSGPDFSPPAAGPRFDFFRRPGRCPVDPDPPPMACVRGLRHRSQTRPGTLASGSGEMSGESPVAFGRRSPRRVLMVRPPSWCSRERPTRCQALIAGGVDGSTIRPSGEFSPSSRRVAVSPNSTTTSPVSAAEVLAVHEVSVKLPGKAPFRPTGEELSIADTCPYPTNRGGNIRPSGEEASDHRGRNPRRLPRPDIRPTGEAGPTIGGGSSDHRGRIIRPSGEDHPTIGGGSSDHRG